MEKETESFFFFQLPWFDPDAAACIPAGLIAFSSAVAYCAEQKKQRWLSGDSKNLMSTFPGIEFSGEIIRSVGFVNFQFISIFAITGLRDRCRWEGGKGVRKSNPTESRKKKAICNGVVIWQLYCENASSEDGPWHHERRKQAPLRKEDFEQDPLSHALGFYRNICRMSRILFELFRSFQVDSPTCETQPQDIL